MIRVGIIGVGNCASALVQGLQYYGEDDRRPGLWHRVVGGYRIKDIEMALALDIDERKVGRKLSEALWSPPNTAHRFLEVKDLDIVVKRGLQPSPLSEHLRSIINFEREEALEAVVQAIKDSRLDVLVNLISSGLDDATYAYADAALRAGCSFINATPTRLASDGAWSARFQEEGCVLVGDDLLSQIGATALHKGLLEVLHDRGIEVKRSYQLDVGGGAESFNSIQEGVKMAKRDLKTLAVQQELPYKLESAAGTTEFVDFLGNRRTSYIWLEGTLALGAPIRLDIYLRTEDAPNAVNVLLDSIRAAKAAKDAGRAGAINEICAYGFKAPPKPMRMIDAQRAFREAYVKEVA